MNRGTREERKLLQDNPQTVESSNGHPAAAVSLAEAESHCRRLAHRHYENFLVASVFLPRGMRQAFYNVYAFCRHADDLADQSPSPEIALERLAAWQSQLNACFLASASDDSSGPSGYLHPIFVALRETIARFDLTQQPFDDLLDAFRQDQVKTRYANDAELLDYCRRSANPVGTIVLRLAKSDSAINRSLSDRVCTGLQLANHWQDVCRDFGAGRIYLPADAMREAGVGESMLALGSASPPLRELIRDRCQWARSYLESGEELARRVPDWLSRDVRLFAHGGLETLRAIERIGFDVLAQRPTVPRWRQFRLVAAAALGRLG